MVGKRSNAKPELKRTVLTGLINRLTGEEKTMKMCESICERFEVPLEKFPILTSMKKQAAVRYHLSKYLREKPETNEYKGLDRVIELF